MHPRPHISAALFLGALCLLGTSSADAQIGGLLKAKAKAKVQEQIGKPRTADTTKTTTQAPSPTVSPAAPAATPTASATTSAPTPSEPESREITAVPAYPGASWNSSGECCSFRTKDPVEQVVKFYDAQLGVKGRELEEMARTYPIWRQQADAYRQQLPGIRMYVYLYRPDSPSGSHLDLMVNPRDNNTYFEIRPRLLAQGSPLVLADIIRKEYQLAPLGDFKPGEDSESPSIEESNTIEFTGITDDVIARAIRINKALGPAVARQEKNKVDWDRELERLLAPEQPCHEKFQRLPFARELEGTGYEQAFCTVRYTTPPSIAADEREIALIPSKVGGLTNSDYGLFLERLGFYSEARRKAGGRRTYVSFLTKQEVDAFERHWNELRTAFNVDG